MNNNIYSKIEDALVSAGWTKFAQAVKDSTTSKNPSWCDVHDSDSDEAFVNVLTVIDDTPPVSMGRSETGGKQYLSYPEKMLRKCHQEPHEISLNMMIFNMIHRLSEIGTFNYPVCNAIDTIISYRKKLKQYLFTMSDDDMQRDKISLLILASKCWINFMYSKFFGDYPLLRYSGDFFKEFYNENNMLWRMFARGVGAENIICIDFDTAIVSKSVPEETIHNIMKQLYPDYEYRKMGNVIPIRKKMLLEYKGNLEKLILNSKSLI